VFDLYFKPKDVDLPTRYICSAGLNGVPIELLRTEYEKRIGYEFIIHLLQLARKQLIIEKGKDAELFFLLTLENSNNAFIISEGHMGWLDEC
jgi:hypothetical protein